LEARGNRTESEGSPFENDTSSVKKAAAWWSNRVAQGRQDHFGAERDWVGKNARRSCLTWPYFIVIFSSLAVVQAGSRKLVRIARVFVDLCKDNICLHEIFFTEFLPAEFFSSAQGTLASRRFN
jgi:hypothetical protein